VSRSRDRRSDRPPAPVLALAAIAIAFFALPFAGLLWKVPWSSLLDVLGEPDVRTALWLSIRTSLAATVLTIVFGVPLA
jgi:molybdate transport system permease protein